MAVLLSDLRSWLARKLMEMKSLLHSIYGKGKTKLIQDQVRAVLNKLHYWCILGILRAIQRHMK